MSAKASQSQRNAASMPSKCSFNTIEMLLQLCEAAQCGGSNSRQHKPSKAAQSQGNAASGWRKQRKSAKCIGSSTRAAKRQRNTTAAQRKQFECSGKNRKQLKAARASQGSTSRLSTIQPRHLNASKMQSGSKPVNAAQVQRKAAKTIQDSTN
jgi:hypothetical protein